MIVVLCVIWVAAAWDINLVGIITWANPWIHFYKIFKVFLVFKFVGVSQAKPMRWMFTTFSQHVNHKKL